MPESVQDRPTTAHEYIFLFSKQARYYYDQDAIRQQPTGRTDAISSFGRVPDRNDADRNGAYKLTGDVGANARSVWAIPTQGYSGAHFATFPEELPRRCILAGTSEKGVCAGCGAPWVRVVEKELEARPDAAKQPTPPRHDIEGNDQGNNRSRDGHHGGHFYKTETLGWEPTCQCDAGVQPATVLDCFAGSGTTLAVAQSLGRNATGVDLNTEYLTLATKRIGAVNLPLPLGM